MNCFSDPIPIPRTNGIRVVLKSVQLLLSWLLPAIRGLKIDNLIPLLLLL